MTKVLLFQAISKFISGFLAVGLLIFLPAGTLQYRNGWLLMGILFVPMLFAGIVMLFKRPELLKKRLNAKESLNDQKQVVALSGVMFILGFICAGLNFRYSWLILPDWLSLAGAVVFFLSYLLYAQVLRENVYLSRTIEVQENQTVIDTGLYGIVRHPMYAATLIMFLSIPLVLGSPVSLVIFLSYPVIIAKRIRGEEAVLEKELDGYAAYKEAVKYRLIPFLW